jgi:hypothetical protein
VIVVLYTHAATHSASAPLQFPPPHSSEIRRQIKRLKKSADQLSPRVVFARLSSPEAAYFECHLVEENNVAGPSFAQFLAAIEHDTEAVLGEQYY